MEIAGNNTPWYLLSELGRILLTEIGHAQHCAEPYLGLGIFVQNRAAHSQLVVAGASMISEPVLHPPDRIPNQAGLPVACSVSPVGTNSTPISS
jgi:hypothetical protein